jgi:DNA-binding NarL/FixJ family response regulator
VNGEHENRKLNILLADDQALIRESLKTFLCNYADDMDVGATARNGKEAVRLAEERHPDIVLMDVRMPEMDGVEAVRIIKQNHPDIKILMLSTYDEDEFVRSALLAGASGYLLKDISPTELITAIRALKNNIMQISTEIVRKMVRQKYNGDEGDEKPADTKNPTPPPIPWLKTLTKREREIVTLLATGYDNEKIAETLFLAPQTVKNHVSVIYSKLGVKNRFEIIRLMNK